MEVAVTGAQGMLGSELCRQLGAKAVPLDLPQLDLTDRRAVESRLMLLRPDALINTAAFTAVDLAQKDVSPCRRLNVDAVATLADVCRRLDCPLVQISTDYVFGADATRRTPYLETDRPGAVNVYGRSKLDSELHASGWSRHFIVRTCGLYGTPGTRSSAGDFVSRMLTLGIQRERLAVVDDQWCSPSFVPHVAAAIIEILRTESYGIYHVVNPGETTWHEFACEIFRFSGMNVTVDPISTAEYGAAAPRPSYSVLDTSKYRALAGAPLPPWRAALAEHLTRQSQSGTVI